MPKIPPKEEFNAIAIRAQTGNERAKEELLDIMRPYVVRLVAKIHGDYSYADKDEITQSAWLGVFVALKSFDPEGGTQFSSWAWPHMQHEVFEWLSRNSGAIPMPRTAWKFTRRMEAAWMNLYPDRPITDATEEELADLEIPAIRDGVQTTIKVGYGAAAMRAKLALKEVDEDFEPSPSPSAEDDYFEISDDDDDRDLGETLILVVDALRELPEDEREDAAVQVAEDLGLPFLSAQKLVEQAGF
jgi:RNA polymerase sigma factor (sigma-70 family)